MLRKFHDTANGCNQSGHIHGVCHQVTGRNPALYHKDAATQNDHQIHQPVKQTGGALECRHQTVGDFLDVLKGLVALFELCLFQLFRPEGLDDPLTQQTVFNLAVQLTDLHALTTECRTLLLVDVDGYSHHQRYAYEQNAGQRQIVGAQDAKAHQNLDTRNEKLFRTMVGEFRYIKQVVCDTPHNLADFMVGVIILTQLLQVVKGITAHIGFDIHTHYMARVCHIILCRRVYHTQYQIQDSQLYHQTHRQCRQIIDGKVCNMAHNQRQHQIADAGQCRTKQVEQHNVQIFLFIRPESGNEALFGCMVTRLIRNGFYLGLLLKGKFRTCHRKVSLA